MKKIINQYCTLLLSAVTLLPGCTASGRKNVVVIDKKNATQSIEIIENDSVKSVVTIKNGKIEVINRYKKESLDGEQLKFHANGTVARKVALTNGVGNGYDYTFFPSGSMASYNYYCYTQRCYFGVTYREGPLNIISSSIHYGNEGKIDKIRLFDTLGNFVKDSFPQ